MSTLLSQFLKNIDRRSQSRRKHQRARVTWPATVISEDKTLQGTVENICRGGALIYLPEQIEVLDSIRVAIEIPDCRDAITADGIVVRSFRAESGGDLQYPFAIAIEFNEISEKDLRFFSGNLAPEWQKNYIDSKHRNGPSLLKSVYKNYIILGILFILLLSPIYFKPRSSQQDKIDNAQIEEIHKRLNTIESKIQSLQSVAAQEQDIQAKIDTLKEDVSNVKNKIPETSALTILMKKTEKEDAGAVAASPPKEPSSNPLNIRIEKKKTSQQAAYHIVKAGETLYRISLNHGLTPNGIRKLNHLDATSQIYPGQRLIIR
ncbi:MAG: LysM peptidoglycan-binding domain-containing protein [Desulfocapsaceae bacterium]|nr:LysM peptidoglycan-binding domain-containing protein [Desulfocapsaceae bacterium]